MTDPFSLNVQSTARRRGAFLGLSLLAALAVSLATVEAQHRSPAPQAAQSGKRVPSPRQPESNSLPGARLTKAPPRSLTFTPEREAAALAFVRLNRPELLELLEDLRTRNATEYQRAICDFFWTSEHLAAIREGEPGRYELALRTWQLETQTHLLTSQLAARSADAERLRAELEQVIQQLVDAQIASSAYEVRRMEAQLCRAQDRHKRLEGRRDELVREHSAALSQAIEQSVSTP